MAAINAATVPETLVESALFGHVKGAFTGAQDTRAGRLRIAHGGSFFLDEVGDLPSHTQIKLLRVMETNEVYPLGSDSPETVDVRYIAATHKDLEQMVEAREFRRDLFQRLAGNVIRIPPLRERPDDMVEIGVGFVRDYLGEAAGSQLEHIEAWLHSEPARAYAWPGNVRELQNALRNLMLGLDPGIGGTGAAETVDVSLPASVRDCEAPLESITDWYLQRVLEHCDGNFTLAAKVLEVDRSTVRRRISAIRASR
jgi:transcriptional regulator with PAS, ATPase and Fis domain